MLIVVTKVFSLPLIIVDNDIAYTPFSGSSQNIEGYSSTQVSQGLLLHLH